MDKQILYTVDSPRGATWLTPDHAIDELGNVWTRYTYLIGDRHSPNYSDNSYTPSCDQCGELALVGYALKQDKSNYHLCVHCVTMQNHPFSDIMRRVRADERCFLNDETGYYAIAYEYDMVPCDVLGMENSSVMAGHYVLYHVVTLKTAPSTIDYTHTFSHDTPYARVAETILDITGNDAIDRWY